MAHRNHLCIYDNTLNLQIYHKNCFKENRSINIFITDYNEHLQIKIRDTCDFVFNYTANIDGRLFDLMRNDQSLDIDFKEFRINLIDMLQQVQSHEMYLKCEAECNNAKLIFYNKSKIKSIVFLTIDLKVTNQKEVFDEMNSSILQLQTINNSLSSQLQLSKSCISEKNHEIEKYALLNRQLQKHFLKELEQIGEFFNKKLHICSGLLIQKILHLTQKLLKLVNDVEVVKSESILKSNSCTRLVHTMENLRLESIETANMVDDLKRENCHLKSIQLSSEKMINELKMGIARQELGYEELKEQRDEFEKDAKQGALIIAQKAAANEELGKDLVKANQMLISFNHLLDTKNEEIQSYKEKNSNFEKLLQEHNYRFCGLVKEFEEYKCEFNSEQFNKISQDLISAKRKIEEIEKVNRETAKLNELLTRKLASGEFPSRRS